MDINNPEKRIVFIDFARCIALILMIQGHTVFELAAPGAWDSLGTFWNIWNYIRGLTAPAFLLLSGMVLIITLKGGDRIEIDGMKYVKRFRFAIILIIIGYLMHLPMSIFKGEQPELAAILKFQQIDILQLIGVLQIGLLLLIAIFKKFRVIGIAGVLLTLIFILFTPFAPVIIEYLPGKLAFLNYYFTKLSGSQFYLFPYAAYFFFGAALGGFLKAGKKDITDFIERFGMLIGTICLALGLLLRYVIESYVPFDLGIENPAMAMSRIGFVMGAIVVVAYISRYTKVINSFFARCGRHSLMIYILHLIAIYGFATISGLSAYLGKTSSLEFAYITALEIIMVTFLIAYGYDKLLSGWKG